MIEEANTLETVAEISVAIAGFAALAGVLGDDPVSKGRGYARLRVVVSSGLLQVVVAMLPVVGQHLQISEASLWRICAVIALLLTGAVFFQGFRLNSSSGVPLTGAVEYLGYGVAAACQISLLLVAFGVFPESAGFLYLLFLLLGLGQTAAFFLKLLDELFLRPG